MVNLYEHYNVFLVDASFELGNHLNAYGGVGWSSSANHNFELFGFSPRNIEYPNETNCEEYLFS